MDSQNFNASNHKISSRSPLLFRGIFSGSQGPLDPMQHDVSSRVTWFSSVLAAPLGSVTARVICSCIVSPIMQKGEQ